VRLLRAMEPVRSPSADEFDDPPPAEAPRHRAREDSHPYLDRGRPAAARPKPAATMYHFRTMCEVRTNAVRVFRALYDARPQLAHALGEAETRRVLRLAGDYVTCGLCGILIDRVDGNSFVAQCGHSLCKHPSNCWEKAGKTCAVCRPLPPPTTVVPRRDEEWQ